MYIISMLAPYVDLTLWPTFDINDAPGLTCVSLGFIVSDNENDPSWGGFYKMEQNFYRSQLSKFKGKVICSFGGASGHELAVTTYDVNELVKKYSSVINRYKFKNIDFDIEGKDLDNVEANKRRAKAIEMLYDSYPDLKVSCTLPVSTKGLDSNALKVALETPCSLINIMAMDYGQEKDMAAAAISAAIATRKQTKKNIGITVMIGVNDTGEIFKLGDAEKIKSFASANKWVKRISYWSLNRDLGVHGDLNHSSQVYQEPFEFLKTFI